MPVSSMHPLYPASPGSPGLPCARESSPPTTALSAASMVDISTDLMKIRQQLAVQLQHSVTRVRPAGPASGPPADDTASLACSAPTHDSSAVLAIAAPPAPSAPAQVATVESLACPALFALEDVKTRLRSNADHLAACDNFVAGGPDDIKALITQYAMEMDQVKSVVSLHEECLVSLRAALDRKLADEIQKVNSELRKEEDMHVRRIAELQKQAQVMEQERAAHQTCLHSLVESAQRQKQARPVFSSPPSSQSTIGEFPAAAHPSQVTTATADLDPAMHDRLENFYQSYNPAKLPTVRETLMQYKGLERELFETLAEKYGPEPPQIVCRVGVITGLGVRW